MGTDDGKVMPALAIQRDEFTSIAPEVVDVDNTAVSAFSADADSVAERLKQMSTFLDNPILAALSAWFSEKVKSPRSRAEYLRDLSQFWTRMRHAGLEPLEIVGDDVRRYIEALEAGNARPASISRYLSAVRGAYLQFGIRGLVPWDVVADIKSIRGPKVSKNATPALTNKQAVDLLDAIPRDTLKGRRDLALIWTYFTTGCRVSAIINAQVGGLYHDGLDLRLQVMEKRKRELDPPLLEAGGAVEEYRDAAGIADDLSGPLFRPMTADGLRFERRFMNRKTPWRLIKDYCKRAGIDSERLRGRGISPHSIRKTAINDARKNGASFSDVQAFAGHASPLTTMLYFEPEAEAAERAARRIRIRPTNWKRKETA